MLDRPVHPAAAVFPMLPDDELRELAEDIKANGLLHPIVLDREERIIDGRNRYAACLLASVEPTFITFDGDDAEVVGYILSANVRRRHMTKGALAMASVRAVVTLTTAQTRDDREALAALIQASRSLVDWALFVLDYAAELAEPVSSGSLALKEARDEAKRRRDAASSMEAQMGTLRAEAPDLAGLVVEERLTVRDALALLDKRRADARRQKEAATAGLLSAVRFLAPPAGDIAEHADKLVASFDASLVTGAESITPESIARSIAFLEVVQCGLIAEGRQNGRTETEPVPSRH